MCFPVPTKRLPHHVSRVTPFTPLATPCLASPRHLATLAVNLKAGALRFPRFPTSPHCVHHRYKHVNPPRFSHANEGLDLNPAEAPDQQRSVVIVVHSPSCTGANKASFGF